MAEPAERRNAVKEMEALPQGTKDAIKTRFADLPAFTDSVAAKMSNAPFPKALVATIKERDPDLASKVEKSLAEIVPRKVERTTSARAEAASISGTRAATVSLRHQMEGNGYSYDFSAGAVFMPKEADVTGNATLEIGSIGLKIFRDRFMEIAGGGSVSYSFDLGEGFSLSPGLEGGKGTDGKGYTMAYPTFSYERGRVNAEASPLALMAPEREAGLLINAELAISNSVSITARGYTLSFKSSELSLAAGLSVKLN